MTRAQGFFLALVALALAERLALIDDFWLVAATATLILDLWVEGSRRDRKR